MRKLGWVLSLIALFALQFNAYAGTTLAGQQPRDTYKAMLQNSNYSTGIDSTLRTVSDGEGTDSCLQLATGSSRFLCGVDFTGTTHHGLRLNNLTTTQRDALTPLNGMAVYNTTIPAFQVYTNGSWATYQPLDATLTALAAYNTNGLLTQTAADTFTGRTITGTASRLSVTNGNGVAGNPTLDIDSAYVGQTSITTLGTITTGTWTGTDIAFANIAQIATDRLLGRDTAGTGDIESLTVSGGVEFTGSGGIQTSAFTGDATKTAGGTALTLATVNSNVGTFGSGTQIPQINVDGKGRILSVTTNTVTVAVPTFDQVLNSGSIASIQWQSTLTTGTSPFTVASTTKVSNLNADLLDGLDSAAFQIVDAALTSLSGVSWVQGDLLYWSGVDTAARLAKDTNATRYLSNTGTSNNPAWAQIDLSNGVTGTLPAASVGSGFVKVDGSTPLTGAWAANNDITGITQLAVDNININGNSIISTDTNGNIILRPNGNGDVQAGSSASNYWEIDENGYLKPVGTADYRIPSNTSAFVAQSGPSAGLWFKTSSNRFTFTNTSAVEVFTMYLLSAVDSLFGYSTPATTPAQVTADQNNYNGCGQAGACFIDTDAARNFTGWTAPSGSRNKHLKIYYFGSNSAVLKHEDAASTAANRFKNTSGADITLTNGELADCYYLGATLARWACTEFN